MNQGRKIEGEELSPHLGVASMRDMLEQFEIRQIKRQFVDKLITLSIASLGLITALAWDETLRDLFRSFFGSSESLSDKFLYSSLITILAVVISIILGKFFFKSKIKK